MLLSALAIVLLTGSTIRQTTLQSSAVENAAVLICKSSEAYAYHNYRCSGLARCKHEIVQVSIDEAQRLGYRSCKICY